MPANISSKEDLQHLVDETNRTFGKVDVLVCNAASNPYYGPMSGVTDDQFRKVLDNNVISNHWLIQMVAPQMIERREGSIIIVSSIGGLRGSPTIGVYNVSKAADFQLARNLAVEFGPHNVRVNCIAPGLIKTDFARALWEDPGALQAVDPGRPAAPHRRASRDCGCGLLPGVGGQHLHDRPGDGGGRRRRRSERPRPYPGCGGQSLTVPCRPVAAFAAIVPCHAAPAAPPCQCEDNPWSHHNPGRVAGCPSPRPTPA